MATLAICIYNCILVLEVSAKVTETQYISLFCYFSYLFYLHSSLSSKHHLQISIILTPLQEDRSSLSCWEQLFIWKILSPQQSLHNLSQTLSLATSPCVTSQIKEVLALTVGKPHQSFFFFFQKGTDLSIFWVSRCF